MDIETTVKDRNKFARRTAVLAILLSASVVSNSVLSVLLVTNNKIVLVPTLPASADLNPNGSVSREYLEFLSRDIAWLFLNRTTETAGYLEKEGRSLIDPETFEKLRLQMERSSRAAVANHQTQSFAPSDFYIDPANLIVEVTGQLSIATGNASVDTEDKIYRLTFSKHGARVLLKEIREITKDEAQGTKVQYTPPPPPKPLPPASEE